MTMEANIWCLQFVLRWLLRDSVRKHGGEHMIVDSLTLDGRSEIVFDVSTTPFLGYAILGIQALW